MTQLEKIDYAIKSLEIAKAEAQKVENGKGNGRSGTVIRESLKMASRIACQVANSCVLGCCTYWRRGHELFVNDEDEQSDN